MPKGKSAREIGQSTRGMGRPTTTVLTRPLIAEAALKLLDASGAEGFTMSRLAKALGVRPSALYKHFRGKEEVIAGVRELVSDRIDVSAFATQPWQIALHAWAQSYRVAFAKHPPTIALLATMPITGAHRTLAMYDIVVAAMVRAGWPEHEVLPVIVAVESFVLGSALDAVAPPDMLDPSGTESAVPAFASAYWARDAALGTASPADAAFALGLRALMIGLQDLFDELTGSGGSESAGS